MFVPAGPPEWLDLTRAPDPDPTLFWVGIAVICLLTVATWVAMAAWPARPGDHEEGLRHSVEREERAARTVRRAQEAEAGRGDPSAPDIR
ncbi:hypothetical protein JSY14_05845 [Brachybacterium sp. EF45031]|uniref:hypothetical protein n=1 Tax=Brachybacterium sillae TaxID=2810536 RepID=UPI00217D19A7|nr:hypothetical protein [Brachybacterium sillae]MCS6711571.1 hypothetical protein [Brachybacterium sillae]